jgi:hypothetical protein
VFLRRHESQMTLQHFGANGCTCQGMCQYGDALIATCFPIPSTHFPHFIYFIFFGFGCADVAINNGTKSLKVCLKNIKEI